MLDKVTNAILLIALCFSAAVLIFQSFPVFYFLRFLEHVSYAVLFGRIAAQCSLYGLFL